jgi:hypothetical protein
MVRAAERRNSTLASCAAGAPTGHRQRNESRAVATIFGDEHKRVPRDHETDRDQFGRKADARGVPHKFNESKRMAKRLTEEWGRSRKPQHPLLHGRWGPVGTHADQLSAQRDERVRRPPGDTHADHPSSRGSERKAESDFRPPSRSSSKSFVDRRIPLPSTENVPPHFSGPHGPRTAATADRRNRELAGTGARDTIYQQFSGVGAWNPVRNCYDERAHGKTAEERPF